MIEQKKNTCNAKTRRGTQCQCTPLPGKLRCKFHGGLSTGPRTESGRNQAKKNAKRARRIWMKKSTPEQRSTAAKKAAVTRMKNKNAGYVH